MLLLYLGKLGNHKFAILVHVKHVSNVRPTFYHLSDRYLPNVMKINVKELSKYIHRHLTDVTQLTGRPPTITLAHTFLNLGPKRKQADFFCVNTHTQKVEF